MERMKYIPSAALLVDGRSEIDTIKQKVGQDMHGKDVLKPVVLPEVVAEDAVLIVQHTGGISRIYRRLTAYELIRAREDLRRQLNGGGEVLKIDNWVSSQIFFAPADFDTARDWMRVTIKKGKLFIYRCRLHDTFDTYCLILESKKILSLSV